jgi:hypothetical protein
MRVAPTIIDDGSPARWRSSVFWTVLLLVGSVSRPALSAILPMGCEAAAAVAEQEAGLPTGLLAAIGQVEAGRRGAPDIQIWPWTVNARGQGSFLATIGDAVAYTGSLLAQGVRSIDVGCFQVNLGWHPGAFGSLAEAFDPLANARYAARFLAGLRRDAGDWGAAIARYHSATEQFGVPYRSLVFAAWSREPFRPSRPISAGDPVVIRMPQASQVHVFYGAISMPREP